MRVWFVAALALASGCIFAPPPPAVGDDDAPPIDATPPVIDTPDGPPASGRAGSPIAVWTFDETGPKILDGIAGKPIDLTIDPAAVVTRVAGGLSVDARSKIQSAPQPHANTDVKTANAVTFEVWVTPANTTQGEASYTIIAGITLSSMLKNLSIEQRGGAWAARVNTTATTAAADPAILSTEAVDTVNPTHLVVVADATERTLYVNGVAAVSMPVDNGPLTTWNADQRVRIADETTGDRHWLGTYWFMAIYNSALSAEEVMTNFNLGFDCTGC